MEPVLPVGPVEPLEPLEPVGPVGPGYFYEGPTGPIDGNPSNDWGDAGNCTWSFV